MSDGEVEKLWGALLRHGYQRLPDSTPEDAVGLAVLTIDTLWGEVQRLKTTDNNGPA